MAEKQITTVVELRSLETHGEVKHDQGDGWVELHSRDAEDPRPD